MADLTREDILKLAKLSRINLTDEEVDEFTDELSAILHYVEQLEKINVDGLKPTSQVTGLVNVTRPDVVQNYGYDPADLLKNVPEIENDLLKVKRMIG